MDDSDAPAFRIEDLFDRASTGGIVEDKDADLLVDRGGTSTHNTEYTPNWLKWERKLVFATNMARAVQSAG